MGGSSKTVRKLEVATPVPADIDIANAVEPLHIADIAADLNLSPRHYDLYGKYKAKVFSFLSLSFDFLIDSLIHFTLLSLWVSKMIELLILIWLIDYAEEFD